MGFPIVAHHKKSVRMNLLPFTGGARNGVNRLGALARGAPQLREFVRSTGAGFDALANHVWWLAEVGEQGRLERHFYAMAN